MFRATLQGPQPSTVVCSPGTAWDQWSNACECPDGMEWDPSTNSCQGKGVLTTLWDAFTTTPTPPPPAQGSPIPAAGASVHTTTPVFVKQGFSFKSPLGILLILGGAFAGYKVYQRRKKA